MAIFLTESSKVIVQGMTGSECMKHTQRMLDSGTRMAGAPEPSTWARLALGFATLGFVGRRRQRTGRLARLG